MALNRVTFFYEQGENGWSESLHNTAADTSVLIAQSLTYAQARMDISDVQTFMTHVRISDDLVFRDIVLDPIPLPRPGTFKAVNERAESPFTALNFRMAATPTVQRTLFLRGIPAGQINGVFPQFQATYAALVNRYLSVLTGGTWGIKYKDRSQQKQPIATISVTGAVVMANPIVGLNNFDIVQVLGIPRSVIEKRQYTATNVVDGAHFTLRNYQGPAISNVGFLRRVVPIISPIVTVVNDAVTERRVGRPFGQLRGRRAVIR